MNDKVAMRSPSSLRILLLLATLVVAGCESLSASLVDRVPPRALTESTERVLKRRILKYARQHDRLPPDLAALDEMPGYDNDTTDAWGNPILYTVGSDGSVTLTSFGSDGKPGGTGDAADIINRFAPKQADGTWSDELVDWLPDDTAAPKK
ncbi:MAG TPA: type II secretion system protein GspG [Pirellulales bacterium]|nr:type II secretion system protein GspG [Pirellulales bacterium]